MRARLRGISYVLKSGTKLDHGTAGCVKFMKRNGELARDAHGDISSLFSAFRWGKCTVVHACSARRRYQRREPSPERAISREISTTRPDRDRDFLASNIAAKSRKNVLPFGTQIEQPFRVGRFCPRVRRRLAAINQCCRVISNQRDSSILEFGTCSQAGSQAGSGLVGQK